MESNPLDLVKAISDYGPYAVILAVVVAIFIYIIYNNHKMYEKFQKQSMQNSEEYKDGMVEITKRVVDQILDTYDKKLNSTKKEPDLMETFVKLRESMQDYCKDCMDNIRADRLAIYLFHNGAHSTHGIKFFKVSCICENVRIGSGIREHSIEHSNIPLNLFDEMIDKLLKDGEYIIINDDTLKNKNSRIFISCDKIQYAIAEAIFDKNNVILGFVIIESSKNYNNTVVQQQRDELNKLVYQLSPLLVYGDYIDINIEKTNSTY